jgi:signal peptidase
VFLTAVVLIGLLLALSLMPVRGALEVKVVKSGSMEPTIRTGSIVIIKPESSYKVGDIVTFGADTKTQIPTTHRIAAMQGEGASTMLTTKGDANDAPDPSQTSIGSVHGKVIMSVPYAGYVLDFAKQPLGFVLLVGVPAAVIIVEELGNIIKEIFAMRRRKRSTYVAHTIPQKPNRPKVG